MMYVNDTVSFDVDMVTVERVGYGLWSYGAYDRTGLVNSGKNHCAVPYYTLVNALRGRYPNAMVWRIDITY